MTYERKSIFVVDYFIKKHLPRCFLIKLDVNKDINKLLIQNLHIPMSINSIRVE